LKEDGGSGECCYGAPPHARAVKRHQESPLHQVAGAIDKPGNFLQTQPRRQPPMRLRVGQLLSELASLERLNDEESECRNPAHHACHRQLALNQQIRLVASQIIWPYLAWRFSEVYGKLLDCL
jgi:hypothetical protein